ncbi:hypothetical protein COA01_23270 [Bacillus cereus]|uniref:hypothetical protein n=1 Tax=Bacillus cereus TaxID=1396 RepID=UPI000BFCD0C5|nr:hypothetical protein [Bacillus cereus]PGP18666.1 hypothetical protein COA01_23270 [Bacillus cereus]
METQSLVPSYTGKESYISKKRRTRSDRKMRVRLYMCTEEKNELKKAAINARTTMTQFVSSKVEQVSQYVHRDTIPLKEIETREDFINIKLSLDAHQKLRMFALSENVTNEQACFAWFTYSKLSGQKKKSDERKFIKNDGDDFWSNSNIEINYYDESNEESRCIY